MRKNNLQSFEVRTISTAYGSNDIDQMRPRAAVSTAEAMAAEAAAEAAAAAVAVATTAANLESDTIINRTNSVRVTGQVRKMD